MEGQDVGSMHLKGKCNKLVIRIKREGITYDQLWTGEFICANKIINNSVATTSHISRGFIF